MAYDFLRYTNDNKIKGRILTLLDLKAQKKYGLIGKLYTFVIRIKRSLKKEQAFLIILKGKHLAKDNKTRWNSYGTMIKTSLFPQVRQAINRWFDERSHDQPKDKRLTKEDQIVLKKVLLA